MTDAADIAADQLKAIVDRILRLKANQDEIGNDIKEVYAEAKSNGFDKTALGKLVAFKRKEAKDASKFHEDQSIFDLYLEAYERAEKRPHAHARAREANQKAIDADLVETIVQASQTEIGRQALGAALDVMIEHEENSPAAAADDSGKPERGYSADPEAPMDSVSGSGGPYAGVARAEVPEPAQNCGQSNSDIVIAPLVINGFSADTMPPDYPMNVRSPDGKSVKVPYAEFWRSLVAQAGAAA